MTFVAGLEQNRKIYKLRGKPGPQQRLVIEHADERLDVPFQNSRIHL